MARKKEAAQVVEAPEEEEAMAEEAAEPVAEELSVAEVAEAAEAPEEEAAEALQAEVVEATAGPAVEPIEAAEEPEEVKAAEPIEFEAAGAYYYGTGRRKTAAAQVRLYPSKVPEIIVNDKQADDYFSRPIDRLQVRAPLKVSGTENTFRITAKVHGGGISGQAEAVRHGISRALVKANPELRPVLRKNGFLTRDPRVKERKKPGLKRARKAPQYTKR